MIEASGSQSGFFSHFYLKNSGANESRPLGLKVL